MLERRREKSSFGVGWDLAGASVLYAVYYWVRYHRLPQWEHWLVILVAWYIYFSVKAAYKRIMGELERQNDLLLAVLAQLEQERNQRAA